MRNFAPIYHIYYVVMKKIILVAICTIIAVGSALAQVTPVFNRAPLMEKQFAQLPLGAIRADGWLLEQLKRQATGLTGHLDEEYSLVCGSRNCWLGGDGDAWERGPYWIDGLLPLAYILDDASLKAKVQPWIEWTLASQQENGQFGPIEDRPYERGVQRGNAQDWWPRMVMLKVMQQYYMATGDERVLTFLSNYFRYQLKELPSTPLDHWTFWAKQRGGDNTQVVLWLYDITGDEYLLELADLLHKQTLNWTDIFLNQNHLSRQLSLHCVNLGQGLKEPIVYYQRSGEKDCLRALDKAFSDMKGTIGLPTGLWAGDELLRFGEPTMGSELCTAVEAMFSFESMLEITANVQWADRLERVAYNVLPTQANDDYTARQYYQQVNQVEVTKKWRNFSTPHDDTDMLYGTLTGYPCCLCNMHQGWPKLTQNLWYASEDNGLAALVYAPSHVTTTLADGTIVTLSERTDYPFGETIDFTITLEQGKQSKKTKSNPRTSDTKSQISRPFPLYLRIPSWCKDAVILVNNDTTDIKCAAGSIVKLERTWQSDDIVRLALPMQISTSRWYGGGVTVERGPLLYGLKMDEQWTRKDFSSEEAKVYGASYYEVTSSSPWNFGLRGKETVHPNETMKVIKKDGPLAAYPWNPENAPVALRVKAVPIVDWTLNRGSAGSISYFTQQCVDFGDEQEVELIPYGCTTLRIAEFPSR